MLSDPLNDDNDIDNLPDWKEACLRYAGRKLTGRYSHWCPVWDALPVDETCEEFPCGCEKNFVFQKFDSIDYLTFVYDGD